MGRKTSSDQGANSQSQRKDRLKAALKANLQRRKAQTRARRATEAEDGGVDTGDADNNKAG